MNKQTDLKLVAYNFIKRKIINCDLMPGEDMSESEIASEIGISRTPIREALMRLEHENFINIYPRKGIVVSHLSLNVINDIFQTRKIIEPAILKMVAVKLSKTWLLKMKKKFHSIKKKDVAFQEIVDLDKEFHTYIINASGNSYLIQMMSNIYDQNQRIRVLSSRNKERLDISSDEHLEIIQFLLDDNIPNAEQRLIEHLSNAHMSALHL